MEVPELGLEGATWQSEAEAEDVVGEDAVVSHPQPVGPVGTEAPLDFGQLAALELLLDRLETPHILAADARDVVLGAISYAEGEGVAVDEGVMVDVWDLEVIG